jgi:hypothetical protein
VLDGSAYENEEDDDSPTEVVVDERVVVLVESSEIELRTSESVIGTGAIPKVELKLPIALLGEGVSGVNVRQSSPASYGALVEAADKASDAMEESRTDLTNTIERREIQQ